MMHELHALIANSSKSKLTVLWLYSVCVSLEGGSDEDTWPSFGAVQRFPIGKIYHNNNNNNYYYYYYYYTYYNTDRTRSRRSHGSVSGNRTEISES